MKIKLRFKSSTTEKKKRKKKGKCYSFTYWCFSIFFLLPVQKMRKGWAERFLFSCWKAVSSESLWVSIQLHPLANSKGVQESQAQSESRKHTGSCNIFLIMVNLKYINIVYYLLLLHSQSIFWKIPSEKISSPSQVSLNLHMNIVGFWFLYLKQSKKIFLSLGVGNKCITLVQIKG